MSEHITDIQPVWFGYEACKPRHFSRPGKRNYWLIHYIISGKGKFGINCREYELSEGWLFLISPDDTVHYEADAEDPWHYTWIAFRTEKPLPITPEPVRYHPEAMSVFTEMTHSKKMINGKEAFLCSKIWELFSIIMEGYSDSMDHIERALRIIHAEYVTKITIEQIADRLHLDKAYLSHAFKKKVGVSPKQYLTKLRMEQAKSLIQQHAYSVTEASSAVGYDNLFNFSKMYKRYFGHAPTK